MIFDRVAYNYEVICLESYLLTCAYVASLTYPFTNLGVFHLILFCPRLGVLSHVQLNNKALTAFLNHYPLSVISNGGQVGVVSLSRFFNPP